MFPHDAVTVMLRRLTGVLPLLLFIPLAGYAQYTPGSWPTTFLDYTDSTGSYIQDISDQSPPQLDVFYSASTPSSVLVGADGTNAFFRMQLKGNPWRSNGTWSPHAWVVAISGPSGQGAPIGWVSVNATGSVLNVEVKDQTTSDLIYTYPASTTSSNLPAVRAIAAGTSGYFYLDFQVPMAALTARIGITASTPVRFFYGTSASAGAINKDYMTGSTVSFLGLTTTSVSSVQSGSLVLLPVELTSFRAFRKGADAELRWSTATEVNNYGFEIQRSCDGGAWLPRGFVAGAGTANVPRHYVWSEILPAGADCVRYRLRQIDRDGTEEFHPAVALATPNADAGIIAVYPQPAVSHASVSYVRSGDGAFSLAVYDLAGRCVQHLADDISASAGSGTASLNLNALPGGIYFLRMHEGGNVFHRKLVIDGR